MRERFEEGTILFISVIKWVFLASITGIIVGLSTTFFLKVLFRSNRFTAHYTYFYLLLPAAFFISTALIKYLAPDAEGHGTEKVIEAVHRRSGRIKPLVVPIKLISSIITIMFGGAAGKEGPCAQIGGGLASIFADILRFDDADRKKIVICGISAGFASVFGTPIAGAIFGVEVLFVGTLLYDVLLPSFVAGIISFQVSKAFGLTYFNAPLHYVPAFKEVFFLQVVLAGIFFGLCSFVFIEMMNYAHRLSAKVHINKLLQAVIGGFVLVYLAFVISPRFLGLGLPTILAMLHGQGVPWYEPFVKMGFTSITLNWGGSGGIVTPIFYIGSAAGALFAELIKANVATFAALGFVGVLAGCANAPIAASIMSVEMFGPQIAPYATIACVVSFLMTGNRSIYPSQRLAIKKSSSLQVEIGAEVENIETHIRIRRHSFTYMMINVIKSVINILKKIK